MKVAKLPAASKLRQKAEELMQNKIPKVTTQLSEAEIMKLTHELEVHHIELELQNDELTQAINGAKDALELYDFAPTSYFTLSDSGEIIRLNLNGAKMLGEERSHLKGSQFAFFVSDDTKSLFNHFLAKIFESKTEETCELILSVNGYSQIYVHLSGIVANNGSECLVTVVDISEIRKLTELNEILLDSLPYPAMYIRRKDRVVLACNKIALDFGVKPGGHCWRDFMKSNFISHHDHEILADYDDIVPAKFNIKCSFCLGDQCFTGSPQQNIPEIKVFGMIWNTYWIKVSEEVFLHYAIDITERRKAEEDMRESESRLRNLLQNVESVSVQGYAPDGTTQYWNKASERLYGYTAEEAIGRNLLDLIIPSEMRTDVENAIQQMVITGQPIPSSELLLKRKDDSSVSVFSNHSHVQLPGRQPELFCIDIDITQRKEAEEKLLLANARLRQFVDSDLIGVVVATADGEFIEANDYYLNVIGYSREEFEAGLVNWRTITPPEWIEVDEESINTLLEGEISSTYEKEYVRRDGKRVAVVIADTLLPGTGGHIAGFVLDITSRKEAEKIIQLQNEELQFSNAEKDKFFSIIAHDLRSPFNGFLGLTEIMAEKFQTMSLDEIQKIALVMRSSATNLFSLLGNLLEWSRMQRGLIDFSPATYLLKAKISESIVVVHEAANKKGIRIITDIPADLNVFADANMLDGIIRNLVFNAVKFSHKGGTIMVSARSVSGNNVEIAIKDQGIGMDQERIDNLFRLDVNTSRRGTENEYSSGLGLIICKDFIEKHLGKLWVESDPEGKSGEKGSTFRVMLPGQG